MPQIYEDSRKQKAFQNAIDAIYCGYGKEFWDDCGVDPWERDGIWINAKRYVRGKF